MKYTEALSKAKEIAEAVVKHQEDEDSLLSSEYLSLRPHDRHRPDYWFFMIQVDTEKDSYLVSMKLYQAEKRYEASHAMTVNSGEK